VHVRLTGLCSIAHLNDREGVLIDEDDPRSSGRRTVRLGSGFKRLLVSHTDVSVKPLNFEMVSRPNYPPVIS
jgi:hypothetical protein